MAPPPTTLSPAELARYSRHLMLEEIGHGGQERLAAARVLVIGAGGLGSPAALYLAAAGVGTLGIADFDRVEVHNLHRQLLHQDDAVGQPKVESAAARLRATNPHITVVPHPEGITAANAVACFSSYDVIVDGTDTFAARYRHNDAAVLARRPLVHGSVFRFDGQVSVLDPAGGGPCYRCLFPQPPPAGSVPSCGEAGVLGALCGVIGSLQALEAIKLLTGCGEPLRGRWLTYDARRGRFETLTLPRDPHCPACGDHPTIHTVADEAPACVPPSTMSSSCPLEVPVTEAKRLCDANPAGTLIIDVREPFEREICAVAGAEAIPMQTIPGQLAALPRDRHLLILCHAGGRSMRVTQFLRANGLENVSNIAGGIDAWAREIDPTLARY